MSKRKINAGSTSVTLPIFVYDLSSSLSEGLGSLAYNTSGLAAKYRRQGGSTWTTITLATATVGTWTSGGFAADGGPVTGGYEIGVPNAAVAVGATWVEIEIYGAASMAPVLIEIELDAIDYQDGARLGLTAFDDLLSIVEHSDPFVFAWSNRADLLLVGDSEILHGGDGIDAGMNSALLEWGYDLYATPWISCRENDGNSSGQGYFCSGGNTGSEGNGTPPSDLAVYMGQGSLVPDYPFYGDQGFNNTGGLSISAGGPWDLTEAMQFSLIYGTFPSGTHTFYPEVFSAPGDGRQPLTGISPPINATTSGYGLVRLDAQLAADPSRSSLALFAWRPTQFGITPATGLFGVRYRASFPARTSGWAVGVLHAAGGTSARAQALVLQAATDEELTEKIRRIRDDQGDVKKIAILIYGGQNDVSVSTDSVGPNPAASNTIAGTQDNWDAILYRLRAIFLLNGWPLSELSIDIVPTHPMAPDDVHEIYLAAVTRPAAIAWAARTPQAKSVNLAELTTYAYLTAQGYYADPGHMTGPGYQYLCRLIVGDLVNQSNQALRAKLAAVKVKTDLIPASPAAVSDIPTAAANAAATAAQVTADHGAGSYVRNTEPLTAQGTADAMKTAPTAGSPAAGSVQARLIAISAANPGIGSGDTAVNHNTGGADALACKTSGGDGIDGVTVLAYVATEYASNPATAVIRGQTVTDSNGEWVESLYLNSGVEYTIAFIVRGFRTGSQNVTP